MAVVIKKSLNILVSVESSILRRGRSWCHVVVLWRFFKKRCMVALSRLIAMHLHLSLKYWSLFQRKCAVVMSRSINFDTK